MVTATSFDVIPLCVWDLIVDLLDHDEDHQSEDCCCGHALARLPEPIRTAARGIRTYRRLTELPEGG